MKINVKTLKGADFFDLNLEETATVGELKQRIATEKAKEADTIKLVHKGKQLNDDTKTLKDHDIKDNDFVILMYFVKKAEKVEESTSASTTASTTTASTNPVTNPAEKPPAVASSTTGTAVTGGSSDLLQGPELEAKIKEIEDMGFDRPRILQALRAAYNNPERAIDYLLSGNIPQVREPAQNVPGGQQPLAAGQAGGAGLDQLQQLAQNPQFQQIAQAIRQNPALLQPVMQQLAQTNPDVARLLQQNPQAFLSLLLQASGEGGQQPQVPRNAIQVTPEEKADIDEIVSLGFEKNDALEAYLACDRQKELAINYLFDARESGALLSEHIEKEELEAAQSSSLNPGQPNPNQPPAEEEDDGEDDDDDFMYQ